jgi:GAF domain-containing protein/HAMP domain-containing protein
MDKKARRAKRGFINLQTKLAAGFALMAVISAGIVTGAIYASVSNRIFQDVRNRLLDTVSIGVLHVDGDAHTLLTEPEQESSSEYLALKEDLQAIRDAGTDLRFVYSMRNIAGKVYFVVDAEESPEDVSHLGDEYADAPTELITKSSAMSEPYVEQEFYTDQWGTFLSGYAPIFRSDGTLDAVLGIDIEATDVVNYQRSLLLNALFIYLLTVPLVSIAGWILGRQLAAPIQKLTEGARRIEAGDLAYQVVVNTKDEFSLLADAFNSMSAQIQGLVSDLERRVLERTYEVDRRSTYISTAADVSRVATTIREPEELIHRVVELIREGFSLYYVGLFLLDEKQEDAVLRAGTGEAGRVLIGRGHRINKGEGMIGWCIENSRARVALAAEQDTVRLPSPLLPNTRSEAALPMRVRGQVIGALTVQSEKPGAFDETILAVLQAMVDQIGVALDNARLFSENEKALNDLRHSMSSLRSQAWEEMLQKRLVLGYHGDSSGIQPIREADTGYEMTITQQEEETDFREASNVHIPLKIRDQVLGYVEAQKPQGEGGWSNDEVVLMNTIVDQLGVALENARLFEESLRKAERERILADITGRVRSSTDINFILQTAVQDLAEALRVPRGAIRLFKHAAHSQENRNHDFPTSQISGNGGSSNE